MSKSYNPVSSVLCTETRFSASKTGLPIGQAPACGPEPHTIAKTISDWSGTQLPVALETCSMFRRSTLRNNSTHISLEEDTRHGTQPRAWLVGAEKAVSMRGNCFFSAWTNELATVSAEKPTPSSLGERSIEATLTSMSLCMGPSSERQWKILALYKDA